ncbi:MAG: RNA polymerase sigma factor [Acidimicrobiia bacterium]|nr:RNA polymerase sigma factor [Acidimicrobiia bacterium]
MSSNRHVTADVAPWSDPFEPGATAELVEQARSGDRAAFDQLVRATYTDTYTLAYRLTGDEEDARDVVQETYLRAFRGLARFRGDAQFSTWLYRITANCANTLLTRRARHRHDELSDDAPVIDERPENHPQARAENEALRHRLRHAIERLPPRLRAVVVLRDVYDLPHEAIATELGITETAAKVRLHRARRRLRDDLFGERRSDTDDAEWDRSSAV